MCFGFLAFRKAARICRPQALTDTFYADSEALPARSKYQTVPTAFFPPLVCVLQSEVAMREEAAAIVLVVGLTALILGLAMMAAAVQP